MLNQCLLYIITVSLSTKKNCLITASNKMYILENDFYSCKHECRKNIQKNVSYL